MTRRNSWSTAPAVLAVASAIVLFTVLAGPLRQEALNALLLVTAQMSALIMWIPRRGYLGWGAVLAFMTLQGTSGYLVSAYGFDLALLEILAVFLGLLAKDMFTGGGQPPVSGGRRAPEPEAGDVPEVPQGRVPGRLVSILLIPLVVVPVLYRRFRKKS
ncbi:hypothetical protein [Streptomyces spororaveus]|nr:hypothetical protein [Streptomyces spororaveus]